MKPVITFIANEDGPTTVEYAVMLMLIAGSLLTVIQLTGANVSSFWTNNSTDLNRALENAKE